MCTGVEADTTNVGSKKSALEVKAELSKTPQLPAQVVFSSESTDVKDQTPPQGLKNSTTSVNAEMEKRIRKQ